MMHFSDEQVAALRAPLDRAHVAKRKQGGSQVSYIEGWHAIAEANRIFGFDAWQRETVELRQLGDPILGKDKYGNDQWRANYMAKVRITVGSVIREGCGFGQGIDKDVGQAHESALKEAETDAMKRAFMTFGNPFGLALYDKSQSNVADTPEPVVSEAQWSELTTLMEQTNADTKGFCEFFHIQSVKDLPASCFDRARTMLNKKLTKEAA